MGSIWSYLFGGGKKKRKDLLRALGPPGRTQPTLKKKKSWVYDPKTRRYGPPVIPATEIKKRFEVSERGSGVVVPRKSFKKKKEL